jgi:hypothetical protein
LYLSSPKLINPGPLNETTRRWLPSSDRPRVRRDVPATLLRKRLDDQLASLWEQGHIGVAALWDGSACCRAGDRVNAGSYDGPTLIVGEETLEAYDVDETPGR